MWLRSYHKCDYVIAPVPGLWCIFTEPGGVGIVFQDGTLNRRWNERIQWYAGPPQVRQRFGDGPEINFLGFRWHDLSFPRLGGRGGFNCSGGLVLMFEGRGTAVTQR